ncbi:nuclear mRNA splicing protein [Pterulicium gracile]|uniref:Nuclear mRNA splicing protein n=1 Tax=Pterulicium gracile TaxID=1884261 RepID=A0A5C3QTX6_9AGAR|nr:nuclear mRNA splicing protein [Pterula gracilis]
MTTAALARDAHCTLSAHKGPVNCARYSKGTARYILTAGQDKHVRLWNAAQGTQIKAFPGHGYEVLSVSVAHDNASFASSGGDRSVFVWDVAAGVTTRRLSGHMGKVNVVEFNEDSSVLASGSFDSTVRLWDLRAHSRTPIQILEESTDAVQALHIGPTIIVTGSVDGHVRTYDLRKGELRSDFIGHPIGAVVPTQDLQTYLITSLDSHIRLLDSTTGKLLNDFTGHANSSYRCRACFDHNEGVVLCGDEEGRVWAWDLVDAKPLKPAPPPKVHKKLITWTEKNPVEPSEYLTACADGTVTIWKHPSTGQ